MKHFKAILFDLDGVIVNTEHLHRASFNELVKKYKIKISKDEWEQRFLGTSMRYVATKKFEENNIRWNIEKFIKQRGILFRKKLRDYKINMQPGFRRFYNKTKNLNYKMIVASGSRGENIKAMLRNVGLLGKIGYVGVDQVGGKRKPAPDIYIRAMKKLKVKPKECIAFEDSIHGVGAAKNAKVFCVALLTTSPKRKLINANAIIKNFSDPKLKKIMGW